MRIAGAARNYEFEGFRLDVAKRQLLGTNGAPVSLASRAFDVLLFMVERPGEMLEKQALIDAVWPRTVVEENNLTQCIFALRRALGDTASEHRFIATVPGRGYQFVAAVSPLDNGDASREATAAPPAAGATVSRQTRVPWPWAAAAALLVAAIAAWMLWPRADELAAPAAQAASGPAPRTIAVLPFADLSPARDMEYFADGIAEELMYSLAKAKDLRVVGRRSAFAFKGKSEDARTIGEKLSVENILEGSVRKSGERVRISAQLVRTRDGFTLWSDSYDRKLDDVLDIQGTIARQVASALSTIVAKPGSGKMGGEEVGTGNAAAYSAYLRGRFLLRKGTDAAMFGARDEFRKAVELDPQFALAHARLAQTYAVISRRALADIAENRSLSSATLERALELDPTIADQVWIRTWYGNLETMPFALRMANFERAMAAEPDDVSIMSPLAFNYLRVGRRAEALELYARARKIEPLFPNTIYNDAVSTYVFRGDRQSALSLLEQIESLEPNDPRPADLRAKIALAEGRALDWDHWTARSIEVAPQSVATHGYLSVDYAHLGMLDAALYHSNVTVELSPEVAAGDYNLAHAYLFTGAIDAARPIVRRALAKHPEDYLAQLARSELEYFSGDCARAIQSTEQARPAYAQPRGAIDLLTDPDNAPILAWCLRQQGNTARVDELYEVFKIQFAPPTAPGYYDGIMARMAAAVGDRNALEAHLRVLADSGSMRFAFVRHEPMIQEYLADATIVKLLDQLEVRRAEMRKTLPRTSMKIAIPPPRAAEATAQR
jgi:TolB-like protein/DNA-binding winged helix-turn-helix (wHTH) protein/Tfp pilus assembly protein PilF